MKKLFIILCIAMISIIFILTQNDEISNHHVDSLSEYFFSTNSTFITDYVFTPDETISFDYYSVTIDEYILDKITGLGMLKCSMKKTDYEKYNGIISPYIENCKLLTYRTASVVETKDTVYFYYYFILNEHALSQTTCTLYFNHTNSTENYELSYSNTLYSTLRIDSGYTITYSPFGFIANDNNTILKLDNYIKTKGIKNFVSDIYSNKTSATTYMVYILRYPLENQYYQHIS